MNSKVRRHFVWCAALACPALSAAFAEVPPPVPVESFAAELSYPGVYQLTGDQSGNGCGEGLQIAITGSDIVFDLQGFTLLNTGCEPAIEILPSARRVTIRNGTVVGDFGIVSSGKDIHLENLFVGGDWAAQIYDPESVVIRGCTFSSNVTGLTVTGDFEHPQAIHAVIEGNEFLAAASSAVSVFFLEKSRVANNLIHTNGSCGYGLSLNGTSNLIENNVVAGDYSCGQAGIKVRGSSNTIRGNMITEIGAAYTMPGIRLEGDRQLVEGNEVTNCATGVEVLATRSTVRGNIIRSARADGILIAGDGNRVVTNELSDNANCGIRLLPGADFNVIGANLFSGNLGGDVCPAP